MPFKAGRSGNPGGRKKSIGLSEAVRESEGLKTWTMLMKIRDGEILEPFFNKETEKTEYLAAGAKTRLEACRLLLSYCWGTPVSVGADEIERRIMELEEVIKVKSQWQQ